MAIPSNELSQIRQSRRSLKSCFPFKIVVGTEWRRPPPRPLAVPEAQQGLKSWWQILLPWWLLLWMSQPHACLIHTSWRVGNFHCASPWYALLLPGSQVEILSRKFRFAPWMTFWPECKSKDTTQQPQHSSRWVAAAAKTRVQSFLKPTHLVEGLWQANPSQSDGER